MAEDELAENESSGECKAFYEQNLLDETLVPVLTTAFYGLTLAGIIDLGMRLTAFFRIGAFSAWLFPQIDYPLVAAGLLLGNVLLFVIKTHLKAGSAEFLEEASHALIVELPKAQGKVKILQKDLVASQEAKTEAQQEITCLKIDLRASQQVVEQQQRQLIELHLQLKVVEDVKIKLNSKLEELKIGLSAANKRYEQAQQQARLADLKANEYAARAVNQAVSDLAKTAETLNAMEKQLKREASDNSAQQSGNSISIASWPTSVKKNYS